MDTEATFHTATYCTERCTHETCPHSALCQYHRDPPALREGEWQAVHTCFTCMEKVLTLWDEEHAHDRLVIPDDCPHWNPVFSSATDCGACRKERDDLKKSHPRYRDAMAASGKLLNLILESVNGPRLPENVVSLDRERRTHDLAGEMAEAMNPWPNLEALARDPETRDDVEWAGKMVAFTLGSLLEVPGAAEEWSRATQTGMDDVHVAGMMMDWTEGMYLARTRHRDDPEALVHEWFLVFTEQGVIHRAWTRVSVSRRKMLLRTWTKAVRHGLA